MKREPFWNRRQKDYRKYKTMLKYKLKDGNCRFRTQSKAKLMVLYAQYIKWRESIPEEYQKNTYFSNWLIGQ